MTMIMGSIAAAISVTVKTMMTATAMIARSTSDMAPPVDPTRRFGNEPWFTGW
jgi:hypothetical protein